MQTDTCDIVKELILSARKGAFLALIGDYFDVTNGFPIGQRQQLIPHIHTSRSIDAELASDAFLPALSAQARSWRRACR